MFTRFSDMYSGGSVKVKGYEWIIIEGDENTAAVYFEKRFNRDPYNVTCNCCGEDYSISSYETLEECLNHWIDLSKTLVIRKKYMQ